MSLLDFFRRKAVSADPAVVESLRDRTANFYQPLGGTNVSMQIRAAVQRAQAATYAYMYSNQPAVRTVVDLIASNVSQLGLKLYERVSDTERQTDAEHPAALSLRYPNAATPADQFIAELTADWCVYNNAYALKFPRGAGQPLTLVRLLPHMVAVLGIGYAVTGYRVYRTDGSFEDFPPERMIHWRSYNPMDARLGVSPLETLRAELVQDSASQAAATELATNGLTGGFIKRPLEAPEWSEEAQDRFSEGWRNARRASPRQTPVLDEGMEFVNTLITPKDAELLKSREFTLETVSRLYGVPVEMFFEAGDDAQAVKRFYSDVLAPVSKKLAGQLDHSILQAEYMLTDHYYEFDLNEKLRGDPVERFAAITSAVGAPWLLRNEARSMENKPPVDGGDELITPLNVLVGDNPRPAPNIMPPQDPNGPDQDGSYRENPPPKARALLPRRARLEDRRDSDANDFATIFKSHFRRQQDATKAAEAVKAVDSERWNSELAADLLERSRRTVDREGGIAAARMMSDFDAKRADNYLVVRSRDEAEKLNAYTAKRISELGAKDAFVEARNVRADQLGISNATALFAWSAKEALQQTPDPEFRQVTVSGGSCDICAPFQGSSPVNAMMEWPPYHPNCSCIAEVG